MPVNRFYDLIDGLPVFRRVRIEAFNKRIQGILPIEFSEYKLLLILKHTPCRKQNPALETKQLIKQRFLSRGRIEIVNDQQCILTQNTKKAKMPLIAFLVGFFFLIIRKIHLCNILLQITTV